MSEAGKPVLPAGIEVPEVSTRASGAPPHTSLPATRPTDDEALGAYRALLLKLEEKSQSAFDKTLITLSGGALGVSFAFVKDLLGGKLPVAPSCLLSAWLLWTLSLASTLTSHYTSTRALRGEVGRVDRRDTTGATGGWADALTGALNATALAAFLAGLVMAGIFVFRNLGS